jgi:hypothetical protein
MSLEVDANHWAIYKDESIDLFQHDSFVDLFMPVDKVASNYLDFVIDSINSNYSPTNNSLDDVLIETAEEFIEKEISLSLRGRLRLIWDLLVGKKISISKY